MNGDSMAGRLMAAPPGATRERGGLQGNARFYLGVDGGATRCRARLRDATGALIGEVEGAAANVYVDFDAAERPRLALGLGFAGLSSPDDARRVEARFPGFALARAANDATTACLGAHGGGDGALVIAGTGSAATARVDGRETVIGGRGFLLGDDGSTARVGAEAIRAALRAHDGVGPTSSLTEEVLRRFGDPLTATQWALTAKPAGYAAFTPLVFERAAAADPVARGIVEAAARAIDALIEATRALGANHVVLVGGMIPAITPYLAAASRARLREPQYDDADGAILIAGGALPALEGVAR